MERGLGTRWFQGVLNCYFQHHVVRKMKIMIMVVAYFTATSGSRWGGGMCVLLKAIERRRSKERDACVALMFFVNGRVVVHALDSLLRRSVR